MSTDTQVTSALTTFTDIFKSSFVDNIDSISALDMAIALGLAFVVGLFIHMIYKKTFKGVMFSENFGVSLVAMTMITTLIILAVTSNIVLSLGMVGALSIVRFRSAIKEPMDIAYIFWAIAAGIVLGAGFIPLAIFGSIFIGIILVLFVNKNSFDNPYIVIVNCADDESENAALELIAEKVSRYVVKAKTVAAEKGVELTVEIRLKDMTTTFVNELSRISGVSNAVLVSFNGEYMG